MIRPAILAVPRVRAAFKEEGSKMPFKMRRAFATPVTAPPRAHLELGDSHDDGVLMLMPAWRAGEAIGVKIATISPRAAEAGFDDAFIYDELHLHPAERSIPGYCIMTDKGTGPFVEWAQSIQKIRY